MGHMHVVEACRGQQSFSGACRRVVETKRVCRGTQACRGSMSWSTNLFMGHVVGGEVVCRGGTSWTACRGITSWTRVVKYCTLIK